MEVGEGVGTVAEDVFDVQRKLFLSLIHLAYVAGNIFLNRTFSFHFVLYSTYILNVVHVICTQHAELV